MQSPKELDWQCGSLPLVEDVPYDCKIILWSKDYIGMVIPHGDSLNPLRWCDDSRHPRWGTTPPEGWWVWYQKGEKKRPPEVKTWAEQYETPEILAWEEHREECEHCRKLEDDYMRLSVKASTRMSDLKDYFPDLCEKGKVLKQALYDSYDWRTRCLP